MKIELMNEAIKTKKDIDFYVSVQRSINNRNKDRYMGIIIEHKVWDEVGNEIQDIIGRKIRELESKFENL